MAAVEPPLFTPLERCWVCGGRSLKRYHQCRLDFSDFAEQDPELAEYTGQRLWLVRCESCGFGQPEQLPALPRYFDRMYDQRWSTEWVDAEFDATYKDFIFRGILAELSRRVPGPGRRLLDVGAHAGRFLHLARLAGWEVEGIELNPRTAAGAARHTGAVVHQVNAHALAQDGRRYDAVTLTDVLEHIPDPMAILRAVAALTRPDGWVAIKVPSGPGQLAKETVLAAVRRTYRVSLADNLVHVSHFDPSSLRLALDQAGFGHVAIRTGAPELLPSDGRPLARAWSNIVRLAVYAAARLPGAVRTPLALNLQAYAQVRP